MEKKEFLNEEKYQKTRGKIALLSLLILIIGCAIGVYLIYTGIKKNQEVESKYSSENEFNTKQQIEREIAIEKENK